MNTVWILVCDAARARLFEVRGDEPSWHVVDTFAHPESRSAAKGLASDHMGHRGSEGGSVHHNALAPASSPKEVEKDHFAHTLAGVMEHAMSARRFHRWVLVAPAHFLGKLKGELGGELQKHLMATVDKDLTHVDTAELERRLRDDVRIPPDQRESIRESDKHAH